MQVTSYILPISDSIRSKDDKAPIFFQYLPKISGDEKSANYDALDASIGRAEQFQIYKSSNNKTLTLNTTFAATGEGEGNQTKNEIWVQRQVKRIQALTEPVYDRDTITQNGRFNAPPAAIMTHGFRYINVPIVVKSVSTNIPDNAMIDGFGALPQVVEVTIQVTTNYPYGYVPGYLNTIKLFDENLKINAKQHSATGVGETITDVKDILNDRETLVPERILFASNVTVQEVG